MKTILATCAVSFLASLTHAPASDEIAFGVSKGTKLEKHFEMKVELELKSASITLGGRELPKELMDKLEMSFSMGEAREIEDEYVEIDGARAKELLRSFRKATDHSARHVVMMDGNPQDEKEDLESPIVDHTVAFTWNAKEEKYEAAFRGEKGQAEWLEKLKEDTDFLRLLPEGPGGKVEVGQTWKIEPKDFNELIMSGGDVPFDKKDKDDEIDLDENLGGEAEAKYMGTREVDGAKLGVIALTAKLSTHHETKGGDDEPPMKMAISFELEGEVLWDLEHKHLRSYELHGPSELKMTGGQELEVNGQKLEMKMRFELAGEMKAKGSVER